MNDSATSDPRKDPDIAFIIKALGKHMDRNEMIKEVVKMNHTDWETAKELVSYVETYFVDDIEALQRPFKLKICVLGMVGGTLLSIGGISGLEEGFFSIRVLMCLAL